jgi:chromosome condensin MukBEF MukE localization factor
MSRSRLYKHAVRNSSNRIWEAVLAYTNVISGDDKLKDKLELVRDDAAESLDKTLSDSAKKKYEEMRDVFNEVLSILET